MISFELIFVPVIRFWLRFMFLSMDIQLFQRHLLKRLFFLSWVTFHAFSNITWLYFCGSISVVPVPFH